MFRLVSKRSEGNLRRCGDVFIDTSFKSKEQVFLYLETKIGVKIKDGCPLNKEQGPVSRKPRKLFGPVKPFSVHLYPKTEK